MTIIPRSTFIRRSNPMELHHGFTLVEISIGLVIIGLLIGGIMVGQDLIAASRLRQTVSQYDEFRSAVNAFRVKYNCLPGDCLNPTRFGLSNPGEFSGHPSFIGVIKGNNVLESSNGAQQASSAVPGFETSHFWYHLSQTRLIPHSFLPPPVSQLAPNLSPKLPDETARYVPRVKIGGSSAFWYVFSASGSNYYAIVGTPIIDYTYGTVTNVLTPVEARQIDVKTDDGLPEGGKVRATRAFSYFITITPGNAQCQQSTSLYATSNTASCNLMFGF